MSQNDYKSNKAGSSDIERWHQEYLISINKNRKDSYRTIQLHVARFVQYLIEHHKANSPQEIQVEDVCKAIIDYVDSGKINSKGTLDSHWYSIKGFHTYLRNEQKIHGFFPSEQREAQCKQELIEKYNLIKSKPRAIFRTNIVQEIMDKLNQEINLLKNDLNGSNQKQKYFNQLALKLYFQIVAIAPIKKAKILKLTFADFSNDFKTLIIMHGDNAFDKIPIPVPKLLSDNIANVINERIKIFPNDEFSPSKNIISFINGDLEKSSLNKTFAELLKTYDILDISRKSKSYPVESMMKTVLKDMANKLVNPLFLAKINGTTVANIVKSYYSEIWNSDLSMQIHDAVKNTDLHDIIISS